MEQNNNHIQYPGNMFDQCADINSLTESLKQSVSQITGEFGNCETFWLEVPERSASFECQDILYLGASEAILLGRIFLDLNGIWSSDYSISSLERMPESIRKRSEELGCSACTLFPLIDSGKLRLLLCCYHSDSSDTINRQDSKTISLICRIAAMAYSRLDMLIKAENTANAIRDMNRSIYLMGPQAKVSEIASEIVVRAQTILGTKLLAVYTIDPRAGAVNCVSSIDTTQEMTTCFEEIYGQIISNRDQQDALIHTIPAKHASNRYSAQKPLQDRGIRSIIAAPIRSEVGISGALIAFFETELNEADIIAQSAEVIADTASVAMSFAFTIEQSHWLLDDLASTSLELYTQASEDALTGLNNHRHLQQALSQLCQSHRSNNTFSFIMADVDFFKRYNDTYGHLEGDAVLRKIAVLLSTGVRQADLVARYGGEEFGIILKGSGPDEAFEVAERIRESIELSNCGKITVTISMGISTFPQDGEVPIELVNKADQALYKAKRAGKNRVCRWIEETAEAVEMQPIENSRT